MSHNQPNAVPPENFGLADTPGTGAVLCGTPELSSNRTFTGQEGWRFTQLIALIKTASHFSADVQIRKDACKVDGKSLVDLLTLGVRYGDKLSIHAIGQDAQAALLAVAALPFFSPDA